MKNFIVTLLLFGLTLVAVAKLPENRETVKQEAKIEAVVPAVPYVAFEQAVFVPLDVYASEGQKISYQFAKTESGYTVTEDKPPLLAKVNSKARKKWIRYVNKDFII